MDLKLAIDGTIVMSNDLRKALDSMYDARIPERWLKVNYFFLIYKIFIKITSIRSLGNLLL